MRSGIFLIFGLTCLKSVVRGFDIKSLKRKYQPEDLMLLRHVGNDLEELDLEKSLEEHGVKFRDQLFLVPKTSVNLFYPTLKKTQLSEKIYLDFKIPVFKILNVIANLLGLETIEDFLLFRENNPSSGIDYFSAQNIEPLLLEKTLADQKISDYDSLFLLENKTKSKELKDKTRAMKKGVLNKRVKSCL